MIKYVEVRSHALQRQPEFKMSGAGRFFSDLEADPDFSQACANPHSSDLVSARRHLWDNVSKTHQHSDSTHTTFCNSQRQASK